MKVIGITGGVGAGKSEVLKLIQDLCNCFILRADELAKSLEQKGEICYEPLIKLMGSDILDDEKQIDPRKMAKAIFEDKSNGLLEKVNEIIHPKVKERILEMIDSARNDNEYDYFFIEAALLIEEGYEHICDELWYIYTDVDTRRRRLKESRGYSDEKINGIIASQLDEDEFRKYCKLVIDNSNTIEESRKQLLAILR